MFEIVLICLRRGGPLGAPTPQKYQNNLKHLNKSPKSGALSAGGEGGYVRVSLGKRSKNNVHGKCTVVKFISGKNHTVVKHQCLFDQIYGCAIFYTVHAIIYTVHGVIFFALQKNYTVTD